MAGSPSRRDESEDPIEIPKSGPTWFLWMWIVFAVAMVVLTVVGFSVASTSGR